MIEREAPLSEEDGASRIILKPIPESGTNIDSIEMPS
jgi:hypothetical protein